MSEQRIRLNINDAIGSEKLYYFTGTTADYIIDNVCYLKRVNVNKGITGTITLVDQAAAESGSKILNDQATSTAETILTTVDFAAQPAYPRRLVITPGGTTADVAECEVTVEGTDWDNASISETFAFAENASTATNGSKRFKTVNRITFPAQDGNSATWDVGERAGDTISILTNPTVETNKEFGLPLNEGLCITASSASNVTIIVNE